MRASRHPQARPRPEEALPAEMSDKERTVWRRRNVGIVFQFYNRKHKEDGCS